MTHFTTKKQSQTLIEAGLNPKTADMWYNYECWIGDEVNGSCMEYGTFSDYPTCVEEEESLLPCWSTGALIQLLPPRVGDYWLLISKTTAEHNVVDYIYVGINPIFSSKENENLIDSLLECVLWCLENGYIEKKGE